MPDNQFTRRELYSFMTGKASTAIARRLQKGFKQAGIDITIEQWSVLYHLWKEDGLSQQQLCDATFRDKPSITRLVDNLEKQKLVKRTASKNDRRINKIFLTKEANQLQIRTMEIASRTLNEALVNVSYEQIEVAKQVLQIVYDNLSLPKSPKIDGTFNDSLSKKK
jgi:DNA-binding MarR family transcriptional regulator